MRTEQFTGREKVVAPLLADAIWSDEVVGWQFERLGDRQRKLTIIYKD